MQRCDNDVVLVYRTFKDGGCTRHTGNRLHLSLVLSSHKDLAFWPLSKILHIFLPTRALQQLTSAHAIQRFIRSFEWRVHCTHGSQVEPGRAHCLPARAKTLLLPKSGVRFTRRCTHSTLSQFRVPSRGGITTVCAMTHVQLLLLLARESASCRPVPVLRCLMLPFSSHPSPLRGAILVFFLTLSWSYTAHSNTTIASRAVCLGNEVARELKGETRLVTVMHHAS